MWLTAVLRVVLRVIVLLFGAALIIGGIAGLIGFVTSMAVGHSFLHGGPWNFGWNSDVDMAALINNFVSPGRIYNLVDCHFHPDWHPDFTHPFYRN